MTDTFEAPWDTGPEVRITTLRTIVTAPEGIPVVVVRVDTNEPGLYGLGCATFTQRWKAVVAFVEYLAPLVSGRYPGDITDLGRLASLSGYWRGGPVGNSAISGLDMALWDILGKRANLPVYELLGGRVRSAVDTYAHAHGASIAGTVEHAASLVAEGWRHIRIQTSQHGTATYGAPALPGRASSAPNQEGWEVSEYLQSTIRLFEEARQAFPELELLHDVHSRLTPKEAVWLARSLESSRPYFLEDVLAPEDWDQLPRVVEASPVPIAVGELATSSVEASRLILESKVDYIRCHLSAIGGLTPARSIATLAQICGAKTAWHSPGDTSPIAMAANLALDVSSVAFGIQEYFPYSSASHDVFPGTPRIDRGWLRPNDSPGWGIDIDETAAAAYPPGRSGHDAWAAQARRPDGSLVAP